MADRWMDERERQWRERNLRRDETDRAGPGGYRRENRSFTSPQSDYDPYAEYRDDYDRGDRGARPKGWQNRHYGGVSPAMRQGEYDLERYAQGRGANFNRQDYTHYSGEHERGGYRSPYGREAYDRQGWGEAGFDTDTPRRDQDRSEHDSAAYRAGDFLGRAGRRVAEFFSGDHEGERRSFRGMGPKGYKRSDARITEDLHDRLTDDPWLDARNMTVAVTGGEVTLGGTVDSRDAKRRAERVAEDVPGVDHVQNNLRVATTEEHTAENESWQPDTGANPLQSRINKGSGAN